MNQNVRILLSLSLWMMSHLIDPTVVSIGSFQKGWSKGAQYVGVLPLINKSTSSVSKDEIEYLTDVVRTMTAFLPKDEYVIITNDNIDVLLRDQDKNLEDCVGECALDTARNLGAHFLITGKVIRFGSSLRVSLNLITSETGNVFTSPGLIKGKGVEDLEQPIQLAALGLMLQISDSFKQELESKAGVDPKKQLQCVLNPSLCQGPRTRTVTSSGISKPSSARSERGSNQVSRSSSPKQLSSEQARQNVIRSLKMIEILGGSFLMGSLDGDDDELPVHRVHLKSFYISKTEVTVGQYRQCVNAGVCSKPNTGSKCNWSQSGRDDHPINCVDWNQARTFAKWVGGDLPSESQWEFAARGGKGNQFKYAGSNNLDDVGWYGESYSSGNTHSVGKKKANGYGLYDMSGNVWEWTLDEKKSYSSTPRDGSPQCSNSSCTGSSLRVIRERVYRGGSWYNSASYARVADRSWLMPFFRLDGLGFRVLRSK